MCKYIQHQTQIFFRLFILISLVVNYSYSKQAETILITSLDSIIIPIVTKKSISTRSLQILSISNEKTSKNSTHIKWYLNTKSTGQVEYGRNTNYGHFTLKEKSFKYSTHIQTIKNLKPGVLYHYRVHSKDKKGNKIVSNDRTFKTLAVIQKPILKPTQNNKLIKILSVVNQNTTRNLTNIKWHLNTKSTGQVEYGRNTNYGHFTLKEKSFKYSTHIQTIKNLKSGVLYHYRVHSKDAKGNKIVSNDKTFRTLTSNTVAVIQKPVVKPKPTTPNVVQKPIVKPKPTTPNVVQKPIVKPTTPNIINIPNTSPLMRIPIDSHLKQWSVTNAYYDPSQSFDKQPGSVKFSNTPPSYIISKVTLPVKAGEIYTLTARMKTTSNPSGALILKGAIKGGPGGSQNLFSTFVSNSKANTWEKVTVSIKIPDNTSHTKLFIKVAKQSIIKGTVWIDNIEVRKGVSLGKRPKKKKFTSSQVSIDTLGNIKVADEPYFPISIFADGARDINIYKNQGFNTLAWARSVGTIQKAKDAGMMVNFEMSYYLSFHGHAPKRSQAGLKSDLQALKNAGLLDQLLFYYWDNEFYHYNKEVDQIANIIKSIDSVNGQKMHPNFMLAGNYGHTRIYNKFIDISGTYAARDLTKSSPVTYLGEPLVYNLQMQDFTENQQTPSCIGQFNAGVNEKFRALIFGGIANGMKGLGYWRDSATGQTNAGRILDVTKQVWWDDLPSIASEIQEMLDAGLIQSSHLTSFKAISNKPINKVISGTRLLHSIGYIIMGNSTSKDETVTFKLHNLGYIPKKLIDFFDGSNIGTISGNTISINVPAYGSRVIKLEP